MKKIFTLFFVALLSISLSNAATVTLKLNVSASPEAGGAVSLDGDSYKASATEVFSGASSLSWSLSYSTVSHDFHLYAQTNEDYMFKGFATSASSNSGNTANPYTVTMSKKGGVSAVTETADYYAIFAKMKADSEDDLAFGQVLKNNSKTLSIVVRHVHAGNVTAQIEGNTDGLFSITQGASASSNQNEVATTVSVSYNPLESETEASATLVISSSNGLNTIRIPLSGSCPPQLTPIFTLEKTDIELEETVAFTFSEYTDPQVEVADESIVSYDATNRTLTGLTLGTTTVTLTQEETGEVLAAQQVFDVTVTKIAPRLAVTEGGYAKTLISIEPNSQTTIAFSTRSNAELTFTQISGENYVSYNDITHVLSALNKGVAEFVASQPENDRYFAAEARVAVWVKSKYHLPITVDESLYNDGNFKTGQSGDNSWHGDDGLCVGGYDGWFDGTTNWDDKYVEFHFEGIPNKLSFEFKYIYRDDMANKMTATPPTSSTVEGEKYFLYLGTIEPRKNLERLITAYAAFAKKAGEKAPKLVLAGGKGWLDHGIYSRVEKLGLTDRVIFTKYVPSEDMNPLMCGALAFVFPSLYEGFGMPPLEAMACGVPVLASGEASLPEVTGDCAVICDAYDPKSIAGGLYRLWSDEALRRELSRKGIERAKGFTWKRSAEMLMEVYRELKNE